jgi:hypothetical protein
MDIPVNGQFTDENLKSHYLVALSGFQQNQARQIRHAVLHFSQLFLVEL